VTTFLAWTNEVPDVLVYVVLSLGAALENVVPAVPADTFVALGGFLAGAGQLQASWVILGTWSGNVIGAVAVYRLSHRHGPSFFRRGMGRYLLRQHQFERMARFYDRWGTPAIFLSRFIPGARALVPIFAGATHQPWPRVVVPIALASAIWYAGLVEIGLLAGRNLDQLAALLGGVNRTLAIAAGLVAVLTVGWWWFTRRIPDDWRTPDD